MMKPHRVPCPCSTCTEDRWVHKCNGCEGGHPTFFNTVTSSPQWKAWYDYNHEENMMFDLDESQECNAISPAHFEAFLQFTKTL